MILIYLSQANLRDSIFIKDLVYNMPQRTRAIVLHDHFGKIQDTRFVTRRISSLLSEAMIYNNVFSGDQRNFITREGDNISISVNEAERVLTMAPVIVTNPLGISGGEITALSPLEVAVAFRRHFDVTGIYVYPANARSPLGSEKRLIATRADFEKAIALYEEEKEALENALALAPALIASATNFAK